MALVKTNVLLTDPVEKEYSALVTPYAMKFISLQLQNRAKVTIIHESGTAWCMIKRCVYIKIWLYNICVAITIYIYNFNLQKKATISSAHPQKEFWKWSPIVANVNFGAQCICLVGTSWQWEKKDRISFSPRNWWHQGGLWPTLKLPMTRRVIFAMHSTASRFVVLIYCIYTICCTYIQLYTPCIAEWYTV